MIESEVKILTFDGTMSTLVIHFEDSKPRPVIVLLMDAAGRRDTLTQMARKLASNGYFVMLPNLFYRSAQEYEADFASMESVSQMMDLSRSIGNRMVARDVLDLLKAAEAHPAADSTRIGLLGFCMSGPFALWIAAELPDRVRAAASIYGVRLRVDASDSPHRRFSEIGAEIYIAFADEDAYVPRETLDLIRNDVATSGVRGTVKRFAKTHHGFAFSDRDSFDRDAAEVVWADVLGLFARNLL